MKSRVFLMMFLFVLFSACAQTDTNVNAEYANVFKSLDGRWEGTFYVYNDPDGQIENGRPDVPLTLALLESKNLEIINELEVVHIYESENEYYQNGLIIDTYLDGNGEQVTVESTAVNKVENGELFCIVNKPDEQVVHLGYIDNENFIVWHRALENPTKVEFFREKAEGDLYTIVGYGYYGNDDPSLQPKTWFYGAYERK